MGNRNSDQRGTSTIREPKPARKLVLLGKTGDGKSSSGNTIFGEAIFETESSPQSITANRKTQSRVVGGRPVTVIDTPGIFDTHLTEEDVKYEIIRSLIECAPAVDAFVIVLKVERYTIQEVAILDKIVEYCGEDTFKHAVILFTHGEELEGQTIETFVQKSPKLQELVNKCGGRCHVIDNKHWNDDSGYRSNKIHVINLLNTIDKMVEENNEYTNELLLSLDEEIQEEIHGMLVANMSTEEQREVAKKNVLKKILIRSAGVATGTLIGAFLGIGVAVASVVVLLKAAKLKEVAAAICTAVTAVGRVADKVAVVAAAGGAAGGGAAAVSAVTAAVEAGVAGAAAGATGAAVGAAAAGTVAVEAGLATGAAVGAAAAAGTVAVEAGVAGAAAGATGAAVGAAAGTVAVETGVAAGAGIGAAAGSGIAVGVIFGTAALAGMIGGGITGYKAAKEADSVLDAIKTAAKVNYQNAKEVVKKAEELPSNVYKKLQ